MAVQAPDLRGITGFMGNPIRLIPTTPADSRCRSPAAPFTSVWPKVPQSRCPAPPAAPTWQSARKDPTPAEPDTLTITFPSPRTIDRMVALYYLRAVNPSPRDFQFQVD
ncbi:MAG: hypothetical protein ABSH20_01765, partial [Tepidisphaeraceae bacterium]